MTETTITVAMTPQTYLAALGLDLVTRDREIVDLPSVHVLAVVRGIQEIGARRVATLGWSVAVARAVEAGDVLPEAWVTEVTASQAVDRVLREELARRGLVLEHPYGPTEGAVRDSIVLTLDQRRALDAATARVGEGR